MHNLKIKPGIGCYCPFSTCAYLSSYAHVVRTDSVRMTRAGCRWKFLPLNPGLVGSWRSSIAFSQRCVVVSVVRDNAMLEAQTLPQQLHYLYAPLDKSQLETEYLYDMIPGLIKPQGQQCGSAVLDR